MRWHRLPGNFHLPPGCKASYRPTHFKCSKCTNTQCMRYCTKPILIGMLQNICDIAKCKFQGNAQLGLHTTRLTRQIAIVISQLIQTMRHHCQLLYPGKLKSCEITASYVHQNPFCSLPLSNSIDGNIDWYIYQTFPYFQIN